MIIGADWWDCMSRNLPLSINTRIDRGVTHYEHGGGRHCMSIGWDLRRSIVGASSLELRPLGREDLGGIVCGSALRTSSGRRVTKGWKDLRDGVMWSRKVGCGGGSMLNFGSCEFLGEALGSWDTCHLPDESQILITIDASRFPTCRSLWKIRWESKDNQIVNVLKLIMTLVWRISSDH